MTALVMSAVLFTCMFDTHDDVPAIPACLFFRLRFQSVMSSVSQHYHIVSPPQWEVYIVSVN